MTSRVFVLWCLTALLFGSLCYCDKESVAVVGVAECVGCAQNNIEPSHAFSGLHVAIVCKGFHGKLETKGTGSLTEDGKFKVTLPSNMVMANAGGAVQLKQQCLAQLLRRESDAPCPSPTGRKGLEASKFEIIFKSTDNGKHTFSPIRNLSFSPLTCTSTASLATTSELPKPKIRIEIPKLPPLPLLPPLPPCC